MAAMQRLALNFFSSASRFLCAVAWTCCLMTLLCTCTEFKNVEGSQWKFFLAEFLANLNFSLRPQAKSSRLVKLDVPGAKSLANRLRSVGR